MTMLVSNNIVTTCLPWLLLSLLLQHSQKAAHGLLISQNIPNKQTLPSIHQKLNIKNLSIIIPAYNEANRILPTITSYQDYLLNQKPLPEWLSPNTNINIIIVDDGSTDDTVAKIQTCLQSSHEETIGKQINMECISLHKNQGKGAAITRGIQEAQQLHTNEEDSYVLITDADGSTNIKTSFEHIITLLSVTNSSLPDLLIGNRRSSSKNTSPLRLILRYGFRTTVKILCGNLGGIKDTQCGFKLISQDVANVLYTNLHSTRWTHDVEVCFIASRLNLKILNVDIDWEEKDGSKLVTTNNVSIDLVLVIISMVRDILLMRFMYLFGIWNIPHEDL